MEKAIDPKFHELFEVHENNFCFECGGRSPVWASVNNGILLCPRCASIHKGFGPNISTVKSLGEETWTVNEIEILKKGGNDKLQDCFEKYNVSTKGPLESKYKTKAAQHHREKLKALVEGKSLPVPPSLEEGSKPTAMKKSLLRARRTLRNTSYERENSSSREPKKEITPKKKEGFKLFKNPFGNKSNEKAKEPKKKKETKETKEEQENKENMTENKENVNENIQENVKEKAKENVKENAKQVTPPKNGLKTKGILSGGIENAASFFKRLTIRKKKDFASEFDQICQHQPGEEYCFTVGSASGDYLDL